MALSLAYWANYTSGNTKLQRKSEDAVNANRVLKFSLDNETKTVNAAVQASMRDRSYKVQIHLDESFGVVGSSCECPLNHFMCHHVAAALLFGYKNVSKTDVPASWIKHPKSAKPKVTKTIAEMFPTRNPGYSALGRQVTAEDRQFMYKELSNLGRFTAMHWILSPEPIKDTVLPVPAVEDLLLSQEYLNSETPALWLRKALVVSAQKTLEVAKLTEGQRDNPMWSVLRKLRFTASNFGPLLRGVRNKRLCPSLKKSLLSSYNLDKIAAISWGIIHEETGAAEYMKLGAEVMATGLWLHESGMLGASPDGIIKVPAPVSDKVHFQTEEAKYLVPELLEVKCPHAAKDMKIPEAAVVLKDFCLGINCGQLYLKQKHAHYQQIQGQLYITKRRCCDLVIWTNKDMKVIRIPLDRAWQENISKLIEFYLNFFIPSF